MNEQFWLAVWNRAKSFLWRFGIALITFGLAWLTDNINLLEVNPLLASVIILGLGEITKAWNTWTTNNSRNLLGFKN